MNLVNHQRRGPLLASSLMLALLTAALFTVLSASGFAATAESAGKKTLSPADIERARGYFTDTELTTHDGRKVRFYSDMLDNRTVVINVIYTSCKGACPMITQMLSLVSKEVGDRFGDDIHFVSISNDPERDTPEVLTEFAQKQGVNLDGWSFLTGPKADVDGVIKKIGLYVENFEQHKSMLLIGNTRTGHWQKIPPNLPPQAIVAKLKEAAGGGS
ncbi:MAG: SCO family protein [Gammaproteobacteria bacterium]|nr:SCO family protein [Gammaproteobacteria bacterium]MDH3536449.1 SCO family protein [Gammaproteobacteria bacterium]